AFAASVRLVLQDALVLLEERSAEVGAPAGRVAAAMEAYGERPREGGRGGHGERAAPALEDGLRLRRGPAVLQLGSRAARGGKRGGLSGPPGLAGHVPAGAAVALGPRAGPS